VSLFEPILLALAVPRTASNMTDSIASTDGPSLHDQVQAVLDLIRPSIQEDGGDLELVEVRGDGTVVIRLRGACVGCPSSAMTLQAGIARQLKVRIPAVSGVEAAE
jgi:Fe-S cluster biogenesis protein NfuA